MGLKYFPTGRLLVPRVGPSPLGVFDEYNDDEPFLQGKVRRIRSNKA